jgi:hypothetical protein
MRTSAGSSLAFRKLFVVTQLLEPRRLDLEVGVKYLVEPYWSIDSRTRRQSLGTGSIGGHRPRRKKAEVVVRGKSRPTTARDVSPVQKGKDAGVYFLLQQPRRDSRRDSWVFYASQVMNTIIFLGC